MPAWTKEEAAAMAEKAKAAREAKAAAAGEAKPAAAAAAPGEGGGVLGLVLGGVAVIAATLGAFALVRRLRAARAAAPPATETPRELHVVPDGAGVAVEPAEAPGEFHP